MFPLATGKMMCTCNVDNIVFVEVMFQIKFIELDQNLSVRVLFLRSL